MPDGTPIDLGDNPSPEMKSALARKYQEQTAAGVKPPAQDDGGISLSDIGNKAVEYAPTIARTAGPLLGAAAGIPGGPAGIAAGAALGSSVGDIAAQAIEKHRGERKEYNPWRTAMEAGTGAAFSSIPMGDLILPAVAAGGLGVVSSNAISLSEGQGMNTAGQNAFAFLTAGGLHAVSHYAQVKSAAVKELAGVPEVEDHLKILTAPDAPTHGPDGVPTEIPPIGMVDEFGKPIPSRGAYPDMVGPPKPEIGPTDPAADIVPSVTTTGGGETKVGQTPVKRPTGLNTASRKMQAKQAVLDTFMEQRRPGIFDAEPIQKDIPHLGSVPTGGDLLEHDGGMEALMSQAKDPPKEMPGDSKFPEPKDVTTNLMRYVGRTKSYFKRLEDETGFQVYGDYDQLSQANRKYQMSRKSLSEGAGKALSGTDRGDWTNILTDYGAGQDGASLQPKLRGKAQNLSKVIDQSMSPFDMSAHDLFTGYIPAMLSGDPEAVAAPQFAKFHAAVTEGKVNLQTNDLPRMMQQITNMGAFEEHAADTVESLRAKYSSNMDAPKAVRDAINYYTGVLDGTADYLKSGLGSAITHVADQFGWKMDGDGVANRIITTQYAAMMAGRPGPVIRNALQPLQTGAGPLGFSWLANGYKQAFSAEGRALIEKSGVAADSVMSELASLGKTTRPGQFVDKTVATFMAPFGHVENINRGSIYLGARSKIMWAAEKYGHDTNTFLTKSGVGRYTQQEANIVLDLFNRGDLEGAADRGAQMLVDNTQFMYSQFERSRIMTGAGRSIGAFGMWPQQYGGYLTRMFQKGANGTAYDIARDFGRFTAANVALLGTFYKAGKFLNDETALSDNLGWLMVAPAIYTGSPLASSIYTGAKQLQQASVGKPPKASDVFRNVAAPFIPFGGAAQDYVKARKEPNLLEGLGRYASIKRGASPKDTGGIKGYAASKPLKGL